MHQVDHIVPSAPASCPTYNTPTFNYTTFSPASRLPFTRCFPTVAARATQLLSQATLTPLSQPNDMANNPYFFHNSPAFHLPPSPHGPPPRPHHASGLVTVSLRPALSLHPPCSFPPACTHPPASSASSSPPFSSPYCSSYQSLYDAPVPVLTKYYTLAGALQLTTAYPESSERTNTPLVPLLPLPVHSPNSDTRQVPQHFEPTSLGVIGEFGRAEMERMDDCEDRFAAKRQSLQAGVLYAQPKAHVGAGSPTCSSAVDRFSADTAADIQDVDAALPKPIPLKWSLQPARPSSCSLRVIDESDSGCDPAFDDDGDALQDSTELHYIDYEGNATGSSRSSCGWHGQSRTLSSRTSPDTTLTPPSTKRQQEFTEMMIILQAAPIAESAIPKNVKKHECKICPKRYSRPSQLATHMNSHSGARRAYSL